MKNLPVGSRGVAPLVSGFERTMRGRAASRRHETSGLITHMQILTTIAASLPNPNSALNETSPLFLTVKLTYADRCIS